MMFTKDAPMVFSSVYVVFTNDWVSFEREKQENSVVVNIFLIGNSNSNNLVEFVQGLCSLRGRLCTSKGNFV